MRHEDFIKGVRSRVARHRFVSSRTKEETISMGDMEIGNEYFNDVGILLSITPGEPQTYDTPAFGPEFDVLEVIQSDYDDEPWTEDQIKTITNEVYNKADEVYEILDDIEEERGY